MKRLVATLALLVLTISLRAAEPPSVEQQVADAVASRKVTVVHFWSTWCDNCRAELAGGGWTKIVAANPEVNFIFVTVRDEKPGAPVLAKFGLGAQKNFLHVQHPNGSRVKGEQLGSFLGQRLGWVPATWVYRDGHQRFAINYGEVRFDMLQQMISDSATDW